MTRDQLIETMARSDAEFDNRPWDSMPRADRKRYISRKTAALTALEAAGMRVVPMREPVMCSACGSHVGCDCTRMQTGTANWMTIAAAIRTQEDSTSE